MDMLSAKAEALRACMTAATQGEDAADALLDTRSDGLFEGSIVTATNYAEDTPQGYCRLRTFPDYLG